MFCVNTSVLTTEETINASRNDNYVWWLSVQFSLKNFSSLQYVCLIMRTYNFLIFIFTTRHFNWSIKDRNLIFTTQKGRSSKVKNNLSISINIMKYEKFEAIDHNSLTVQYTNQVTEMER